jgi:hypothetical protein
MQRRATPVITQLADNDTTAKQLLNCRRAQCGHLTQAPLIDNTSRSTPASISIVEMRISPPSSSETSSGVSPRLHLSSRLGSCASKQRQRFGGQELEYNMASSATIVVSVVDARTETQKHIDNVLVAGLRRRNKRRRISVERQTRIGVN